MNSLAIWLVHFFEIQILCAFEKRKMNLNKANFFTFFEKQANIYSLEIEIERVSSQIVKEGVGTLKLAEKNHKVVKQLEEKHYEEIKFITTQILNLLKTSIRECSEVLREYEWIAQDLDGKTHRILAAALEKFQSKYQQYQIRIESEEIEKLGQKSKKKKKYKPKISPVQLQDTINQSLPHQIQLSNAVEAQIQLETKKIENQEDLIKQTNCKQKQSTKKSEKIEIHEKKTRNLKELATHKSNNEESHHSEIKKMKKLVQERLNDYIEVLANDLSQKSNLIEKHRKSSFLMIESALKQMEIKSQWSLVLFGSCSIGFALKESDLDLVLILDKEKQQSEGLTLNDVFIVLSSKQWVKHCKIIQTAQIPIISLEINLVCQKVKAKEMLKLSNIIINVDLSISLNEKEHEGILNTRYLKEVFEECASLRVVSIIFKQILRINHLNKPYTGGISSYVLVMMIYGIYKQKQLDQIQDPTKRYYLKIIYGVVDYLSKQFQPFQTIITTNKKSSLKSNPNINLNIEDTRSQKLVATSAFKIQEIIKCFSELKKVLEEIEEELMRANANQTKKMKRIFFERIGKVMKGEEDKDIKLESTE